MFCKECGKELSESSKYCPNCGTKVSDFNSDAGNHENSEKISTNYSDGTNQKSRLTGGLLNICFAGIGRIYLGYIGIGVTQLLLVLLFGIGAIWSVIDGIMILTGSVLVDGNGHKLGE